MRVFASVVTFAVAAAAAAAPTTKKDDKQATIRVLDVVVAGEAKGRALEPTTINSIEDLDKAVKDEAAVKAIKKIVDFTKEQVVYFAWSGSGQDKITFDLGEGDKSPEVTFSFKQGLTRDLRQHHKLFAMPRDTKFKVKGGR